MSQILYEKHRLSSFDKSYSTEVFIKNPVIEGLDTNKLVAIKNIEIGEEITFDYEITEEKMVSPFKCECHGRYIVGWNVFQRV